MKRTKTVLLYVMAAFYIFGGFNHLMNPEFYLAIMPPNLPNPEWLNVLSGLAEIVLGVFLLEPRARVFAAWGIIALLIAASLQISIWRSKTWGATGPAAAAAGETGYASPSRRYSWPGLGGIPEPTSLMPERDS